MILWLSEYEHCFGSQGIMITFILMATCMAIGMLVEALLPDAGSAASDAAPKNEKGANEWLKNKLDSLKNM